MQCRNIFNYAPMLYACAGPPRRGGRGGEGGDEQGLFYRCHKILGPHGSQIINIMGPPSEFGAPFELALLARREVAFSTAIYPMQSCQNLPSIL